MNNCSKRNCPMNASTFKECCISDGKCEYFTRTQDDDFAERVDDILRQMDADHEPIKEIPSTEQKTAYWIRLNDYTDEKDEHKCSNCGFESMGATRFCPDCGYYMVEPTCDTCEYDAGVFNPCNTCKDKSEYELQKVSNK